jgi:hypothetical protein
MQGSEVKPGARVKDIHSNKDTIAADLMNGRAMPRNYCSVTLGLRRPIRFKFQYPR